MFNNIRGIYTPPAPPWAHVDVADGEVLVTLAVELSASDWAAELEDSRALCMLCREAAVIFTHLHNDGTDDYWRRGEHNFADEIDWFVHWVAAAMRAHREESTYSWVNIMHWTMFGTETLWDLLNDYPAERPESLTLLLNTDRWLKFKEWANADKD